MAEKPICSIPDCGKLSKQKGWCWGHYYRWRKYGDPLKMVAKTLPGEARKFYNDVVLKFDGDECLLWPYARAGYKYNEGGGYGILGSGTNRTPLQVHRLVCEAFNGVPPTPKHQAAHNCGNSLCVNHQHLRWATPTENMADTIRHGTRSRIGVYQRPKTRVTKASKLTDDDVRQIRKLAGAMLHRDIATQFGISRGAVSAIVLRERRPHVN